MRLGQRTVIELEAMTPPTAEVIDRVRIYTQTAQIPVSELARRCNYAKNTMDTFMCGGYAERGDNDLRIRRAIMDYLEANPVRIATETAGHLYETRNVAMMRHWFEHCLARREMAAVYGPPGSQKTFVFQHLVAAHNRRELHKNGHGTRAFHVYCSEGISKSHLLRLMARAAAIPSARTILGMQENLRYHLHGRRVLFVLDEAQHLDIPALEIVRELNDCEPHAGILLAGSHQLLRMFRDRAAELEQWNSRMTNCVELPGIEMTEATDIIETELGLLDPAKVRYLIEQSMVIDGFAKKRPRYLSAHRLFRQIHNIKQDARFTQPQPVAS